MKKMNKEQFLEAVKKDPSLLLYHPEQVSYDNQGNDVHYYDACKDPFTYQEAKELFDTYFISKRVSAKMPYASRTETPPHKTGVPNEWLDALDDLGDKPADPNQPVIINQGTISKEELIDLLKRSYQAGSITLDDVKSFQLSEEEVNSIIIGPIVTVHVDLTEKHRKSCSQPEDFVNLRWFGQTGEKAPVRIYPD